MAAAVTKMKMSRLQLEFGLEFGLLFEVLKFLVPTHKRCICRAKKARFPKGKKESSAREFLRDPVEGEEDGGPILSTDPRLAAKERAMQRTVLNEQLISSEDVALVEDVVAAEEEVCCPARPIFHFEFIGIFFYHSIARFFCSCDSPVLSLSDCEIS